MAELVAVVVTFHPGAEVAANLHALRREAEAIVVIDNGSDAADLASLRAVCAEMGATLHENGENLGIATALNQGVAHARREGAQWVLLFDQDSCVTAGFAQAILAEFRASRWGERLCVLMPRYRDLRTGEWLPVPRGREGLDLATTSGSLTPMRVFDRFGGFTDELFIDQVDYDFSLRVRAAGGVLDEAPAAVLLHAPGQPVPVTVFGRRLCASADYSPVRRYYQERNRVWMVRRYGWRFPRFALQLVLGSGKELVKLLAGERNRGPKCRAFAAGLRDGLLGRMGKRTGS